VQIVWSWRRGSRSIEHVGSAHNEVELAALKTAAAVRLAAGQTELDLGLNGGVESGMLPITSSRMSHLWDGLCAAYRVLGFESVTKGDSVFRDSVLARIIELTGKVDAARATTCAKPSPKSAADLNTNLSQAGAAFANVRRCCNASRHHLLPAQMRN
jgi:hypothetical protein